MKDNDIKRLSRLTAILTQLQASRILSARDLAVRFSVSTRTIYRDLRALEHAGVPLTVEEGRGYSLVEGYGIPPVMFTEKEANALITAEQILSQDRDLSFARELSQAISKVRAVMRYPLREKTDLLSKRLFIFRRDDRASNSQDLSDLQFALINFHLVKILYRSPDGNLTERIIEPFAFYNNADHKWVLAAYCRLRDGFRSFRLDRIMKTELLEESFEPHKLTLQQYVGKFLSE